MSRSGLRLVREGPDGIEIEGRLSREGPLLVAVALTALAVTPIAAPGPLTVLRATATLALASLAAFIGMSAVGRRRRVSIRPTSREVHAEGRSHPLDSARAFVLTTAGGTRDAEPRIGYRVELELADGQHLTILDGTDPAIVLADLRRLLARIELPVRPGWQIPRGAEPWRASGSRASEAAAELDLETSPLPSQRRAAVTVLSGALFTTVAMSVMFGARLRRGDAVAPLSWALAIGTVTALFAIGIYVATDRVAIRRVGNTLRVERRAVGRLRDVRQIAIGDLRRAYPVGPIGEGARHVLVETASGLHSVPCAGAAAEQLAAALDRKTAEAGQPTNSS